MIKKILCAFVLSCSVLQSLFAATYTIDKRKYVDDKWGTDSYRHILKMVRKGEEKPFCVAHLIASRIIIAKHCLQTLQDINNIDFVGFDGLKISACSAGDVIYGKTYHLDGDKISGPVFDISASGMPVIGKYNPEDEMSVGDDWIVLRPVCYSDAECDKLLDFVKNNTLDIFSGQEHLMALYLERKYMAKSDGVIDRISAVGFDKLRILSDEDIKLIKKKYFEYLFDKNNIDTLRRGDIELDRDRTKSIYADINTYVTKDSGIVLVQDFIKNLAKYGINPDILNDSGRMKEIVCKKFPKDGMPAYFFNQQKIVCPAWGYTAGGTGVYGFAKLNATTTHSKIEYPFFYGLLRPDDEMRVGATTNENGVLVPVDKFKKYLPTN